MIRIPPTASSSIRIDHPRGTEDVSEEMGIATVAARGGCNFDADLYSLEAVHGAVYPPGSEPGDHEYQNYQQAQSVNSGSGEWSFPTLMNAQCNAAGTQANAVKIWCLLMELATTEITVLPATGSFNGRCVTASTRSSRSRAVPLSLPGFPLDAHRRVGRWRCYRNLAVSHPHEGTLLLADGEPLRAGKISVAAEHVLWRTRNEAATGWRELTTAKGLATRAPSDNSWRFNGLNKYGICVWQVGRPPRLVKAERRAAPTVLAGLDSQLPIYVQVNDRARRFADNFGAFDLWVRVDSAVS